MKFLIALTLIFGSAFAQADSPEFETIYGVFVADADCVETGYALQPKNDCKICLGFHSDDVTEEDLVIGVEYGLAGYFSEDGFFVTEISD